MSIVPEPSADRLTSVTLDDGSLAPQTPEIEQERNIAIFDLLEGNSFVLRDGSAGPHTLKLSIQDRMLRFIVTPSEGGVQEHALPFSAFRKRARVYFELCDSYFEAVRSLPREEIARLDQERKALHNEGAVAVRERISEWVEVDEPTARRLFTLVCSLVYRG